MNELSEVWYICQWFYYIPSHHSIFYSIYVISEFSSTLNITPVYDCRNRYRIFYPFEFYWSSGSSSQVVSTT